MTKFVNSNLEKKLLCNSNFKEIFNSSIENNSNKIISFVNPFSYSALTNRSDIVSEVDYWFSDGSLLCILTNLRRKNKITRTSFDFTSIANYVFLSACEQNLSIAFIGGTQDEIERAIHYIKNRYSKLNISYYHNGYINDNELIKISDSLSKNKTDIIICGMGTPLQEEFLIKIKNNIDVKLLITCGGFLTQTSLFGDYYHPIIKKLGLRWLQRAILHKHVRNRLIKIYPKFLLNYLLNKNIKEK